MVIKAAREIKKEIEKAGLDNLKLLCEKGVSIVGTYLNGCTPKEQARLRQQFGNLLNFGVTPEMVLDEIARQIPEIGAIIEKRPDYKKVELQKVKEFLRAG
jgi:hypothetical protein